MFGDRRMTRAKAFRQTVTQQLPGIKSRRVSLEQRKQARDVANEEGKRCQAMQGLRRHDEGFTPFPKVVGRHSRVDHCHAMQS